MLPLLAEFGKVHMSLGTLYRQLGERPTCLKNLEIAVVKLEAFCDEMQEIDAQISKKQRPKNMTYAFYQQMKEEEKVVSKLLLDVKLVMKEI